MSPTVLWIRPAEERLAAALRQTTAPVGAPAQEQAAISGKLAAAFPHAVHVIVLDYYVGFKHRPGEHILQVDVRQPGEANTLVVKIAKPNRLQREKNAWEHAAVVHGGNPVFMPLRTCPEGVTDDQLVAIAYQHAQKHIGAETTTWLESAVRDCVRFHSVTLESIIGALHDIYSQTGRLYRTGRLEPAGTTSIQLTPTRLKETERHELAPTLDLWNQPVALAIRQQVNAAFAVGSTAFLDPVDAFRFWDDELKKQPPPADLLPQVMRGLAHGDLHGRNSMVGIDDQDRANFPTLFDYESIYPDNLIGWDFVEMEVELKIRIFEKIFPHSHLSAWARHVQQFEAELNSRTRQCHESRDWPGSKAEDTPRGRLLAILLTIRQEAANVLLARARAPAVEWLREYLFLLGCYGLMSVRYENQSELQRAAAYVSAGAAAARLEGMRGSSPAPATNVTDLLSQRFVTCQIPLSRARDWDRNLPSDLNSAEQLLAALVERHPATLHVHFEQAFNLVKQKRSNDALKKLEKLHADFNGVLDEDTWSLWGRCFKDRGDANLLAAKKAGPGVPDERIQYEEADEHYREALEKYEAALAVANGFFPAINVATLKFLRAGLCKYLGHDYQSQRLLDDARQAAVELQAKSEWKQLQPDDGVWVSATKAEAFALTGRWSEAGARYRNAVVQPQCLPFHPQTMGRQLARILEGYRLLGKPVALESFGDLGPIKPHVTLE